MRDSVIVSTAGTPIGKAYRGAFNDTQAQALASHAVSHAVERAGVATDEVEDVVLGAASAGLDAYERRSASADQGRPANFGSGYDGGQAMFIRSDGAVDHCQSGAEWRD